MIRTLQGTALSTMRAAGGFALASRSAWRSERIIILRYHGVSQEDEHQWNPRLFVPPEHLAARIRFLLKRGFHLVTVDEGIRRLNEGTLPPRSVALTFEAGYVDFCRLVLPILKAYDVPATLYLTTYDSDRNLPSPGLAAGYMIWKSRAFRGRLTSVPTFEGVTIDSDAQRRRVSEDVSRYLTEDRVLTAGEKQQVLERLADELGFNLRALEHRRLLHLMTPDEVRQVAAAGIDVQMHTHAQSLRDDAAQLEREIVANRERVEALTGRAAVHLSYPGAAPSAAVLERLRTLGIRSATTHERGLASGDQDPLLLPVFHDDANVSFLEFEAWLSGVTGGAPLSFLRRRGGEVRRPDPTRTSGAAADDGIARSSGGRAEAQETEAPRRRSFLQNVAWGWLAVGVNLIVGIVLSPIMIRKLGVEQYGVWVLLFSLLEYMRVLDFGFRAAVLNGCARYRAREDWEGVSRTVSTSLAYFAGIGLACMLVAIGLRFRLVDALGVTPELRSTAAMLIVLIAVTVTVRLMLSPLTATVEALQRFDVVSHAYIGSLLFRSIASLAVLLAGYGLLEVASIVLMAQIGESLFTLLRVRQLLPRLKFSPGMVRREALVDLFRYGRYSAVISTSNLVTINAPTTILGYMRGAAEVGYFAVPFRLLMYSAEGLTKVAEVTSSVTAELDEVGQKEKVWRLAVITNRQCFALFMPLAIFLSVYGTALLHLWVTPEVAENSGHLFPIMVLSFLFAISGQYNAGAVLIGQARHRGFSYGTAVEAIATIVLLLLLVPAWGVVGAAWVATGVSLTIRGAYVAAALCWQNGFPLGEYLWAVYGRGLMTGLPIMLLAVLLERTVWPGESWGQLILAGATLFGAYFSLAFFSVLDPEHRERVFSRLPLRARP